jgi:hypothetical protein
MKQLRIHFFILWFIALNRCNPYLREHINPSLLPPTFLPFFGDAMLFELNAVDRRKLLGVSVRDLLFYRLLGNVRISPMYFRYLMRRTCKISLPLSHVYLPKDYERKFFEAVAIAPERTMFLSKYHHFVEGITCLPKNELVDVSHYTLHKNGRFEAIITGSGFICMGRLDCPIRIKTEVIKAGEHEATFCVFHPFEPMLIVGRKNCIVEFYQFSCDLQSATPSFVMTLVAKHTNDDSQSFSDVTRITVNSSGNLFAIEYKYSMANLVYMDSDGNLVAKRFIDEPLKRQIGGVTAVSFFTMEDSKTMVLTTHRTKYCVWTFDETDGSLTMVSQIDAIKAQYVVQIISHLSGKFIMRTTDGFILVIQLDDDLKGCKVLMKQTTKRQFSFEREEDYKKDSMALFDEKMLIVVVPTQNTVLFFLVKETEMVMMFKKTIDQPLCWTVNRLTGTFSSYYKPVRKLYNQEFKI